MIAKENGDVWCSDLQCWCWVLDVVVSAEWFIIIYVMCVLRMNWTDIMSQTDFFFHCHCRAAPFFFCSLSLSVQSVPCGRVAVNCRLQCKYDARKKHSRQLRKHSHFFLMFFLFFIPLLALLPFFTCCSPWACAAHLRAFCVGYGANLIGPVEQLKYAAGSYKLF